MRRMGRGAKSFGEARCIGEKPKTVESGEEGGKGRGTNEAWQWSSPHVPQPESGGGETGRRGDGETGRSKLNGARKNR